MATHSSTFAWEIPWTEEPGGLQSKGSQRVRQDWVTDRNTDTNTATLTTSGQEVWETEGGGYMQKQQTHTNSPRNWPRGGLICVILMVFSTVNLQFQGRFAPFSWGQSSELWRLMSWLQSGHHTVNLFHLVGVLPGQLPGWAAPRTRLRTLPTALKRNKGLWPCLLTKLLLFCPFWLFSFVYVFSHFSD